MLQTRFKRAEAILANGTTFIAESSIAEPQALIGGFLSRLWTIFGKPDYVRFEGFDYTLIDTETGLIFTAYCAGSGPAYGGFKKDREALLPVLGTLEAILLKTQPADCQISFDTDFGILKSGAKDGIPYDTLEEYS
ncbi:hypothetical protein SAMN05216474_1831 [Lishizhenia tianjinensis]|uniref:Uncharacterized protein n=1 Tax=Lishizhenia tianjinensis TaxID=477690 RepID=A0A1I7A260_9FLAO|nr:hypothetical protein [Lishizhenia tianjinensis]SFT69010.1 hypothetical protein SAMN05216474_1831 [Lishizhenia tianjinensis]